MAQPPAIYGQAVYGQSKYGVLAVVSLIGNATLRFNVTATNKVKLLAMAAIKFVFSLLPSGGRANNFPFRRDKDL